MTGSVGRALAALRSRDFRYLLTGRLGSQFADGFFQAFLIGRLVFLNPEKQGTALGVLQAYAILVIPFSVIGPFAGVLIDRWSRRRIQVATPLIRTASALVLLASGAPTWAIFALALVVVSTNRFFLASANASTPSLVPDEDLLMANSMATIGGAFSTVVGIVAGTKIADVADDVRLLLLLAAVFWACSSLFASRIRDPLKALREPTASTRAEVRRVAGELASGFRRLKATPPALGSVASISVDQFVIGFVAVLSVVVFKEEFEQGIGAYGNLLAASAVGVAAGTVTAGWLESKLSKPAIVALGFLVAGIASIGTAAVFTDLTIVALSAAVGMTFAWRKVAVDTIVQESIPDRYRGRVFSLYDISYSMARVVAALFAVFLIPALPTRWLVGLIGVLCVAYAPALPRWVRRPQWAGVRFYAGGRADEVPRAVVVGGEEEAVREVLRSYVEERSGRLLRRFRLSMADGRTVELAGPVHEDRWLVEKEVPADVGAGAAPAGTV